MSIAMIIKIIIFIGYVVYLINNKKSKQKTKYKNNNYVNEYSQSNTKNIGKKECNTQYYKDVNKYKIITDCLSRIIDKLSYDYDPNITLGEILKLEESNINEGNNRMSQTESLNIVKLIKPQFKKGRKIDY